MVTQRRLEVSPPKGLQEKAGHEQREYEIYDRRWFVLASVIIGCKTPAEVDENARIARQFAAFAKEQMRELERRTRANADDFNYYKGPASALFR